MIKYVLDLLQCPRVIFMSQGKVTRNTEIIRTSDIFHNERWLQLKLLWSTQIE